MNKRAFMLLSILALASLFTACVQMPTETASTVDMRPQISFRVDGDAASMHVLVDGLEMGLVSNYLDGGAKGGGHVLRVLSGTHILKVMVGDSVIHEEKLYVGDGVSKIILIK